MRADPKDFGRLNLRCHALLDDVPLHDVWAIPLMGGGPGRTISDVRAIFSAEHLVSVNPIVRALFALRRLLGRVIGWDRTSHEPRSESYLTRLSDADCSQSLISPGEPDGPFRVLYVFASEALSEIRNATVHAFSALALVPNPSGYTLYWAIYVKPVSRLTRFYMALIDPFRRLIIYPAIVRYTQRQWERAYD